MRYADKLCKLLTVDLKAVFKIITWSTPGRWVLFLLGILFFTSCTIQKRHYLKGFHIDWKSTRFSKNQATKIVTSLPKLSAIYDAKKEKEIEIITASLSPLNKSSTEKVQPLFYKKTYPKSILIPSFFPKPDSTHKVASTKELARKYAKKSHTLGLIALLATVLFIFWIFTVPTAIICGILAIKRGRQAINLIGNDTELKTQYGQKARQGIRMGLSFFIFLTALFFIAILAGLAFAGLVAAIYLDLVLYIPYLIFPVILLLLVLAFFTIKIAISTIKRIFKKYCPE